MIHRPLLVSLGLALLTTACADRSNGSTTVTEPSEIPATAFATRIEVGTEVGIHFDGALADFDNDGQQDLLVVSIEGAIELLKGDKDGGFRAQSNPSVPVVGGPSTVLAVDLDRDLDQDAIVLQADGLMTLFLNDGNGVFTAGDTFPVGTTALCLVSGDIDGDGNPDVVVSRRFAPQILVFQGTGTGSLTPAPSLFLPDGEGSPIQMALGDVIGDTGEDLVVCDESKDRVLVYEASSINPSLELLDPVPDVLPVLGAPSAVSIADLSGDGLNDMIVSAFAGQRIEVITGYDEVTINSFSVPVPLSPGITAVADFTGDGTNDLAVSLLFQEGVSIFPGNGNGGLEPALIYDTRGNPLRLLPGDFNQDGAMDLVAISARESAINLLLGAPDYGLDSQRQYPTTIGGAEGLAHGDLDGDGDEEIIISSIDENRMIVLATSEAATRYDMVEVLERDFGEPISNVLAQDMDGDGAPDLIVATETGIQVLRNTGFATGTIAFDVTGPMVSLTPQIGAKGIAVADMNADGLLDLIVTKPSSDRLFVVFGAIEPFVFSTTNILEVTVPGQPFDLAVADLTGDNLPEVAVSRPGQGFVSLLLNVGGQNLVSGLEIPVGADPRLLADADFNRDGRMDLVVSKPGSGAVQLIVASATEVFRADDIFIGNLPTAVAAGDLNGDGNPDLLVANQGDDSMMIMLGNGNGNFPVSVPLTGAANTVRAVLADTDGDGDKDIVLGGNEIDWLTHVRSRLADNANQP